MVIAIDIRTLLDAKKTGVGEYVYELLTALFQEGPEHTYILFANQSRKGVIALPQHDKKNVHIVYTNIPNKLLHMSIVFFGLPCLDRWLLKKLKGVVDGIDYFFSPNLGFCALSRGCKQILTLHDMSFKIYTECLTQKRRLWHTVLRPKAQAKRATKIIVPSDTTKRDVAREFGVSLEKITTIYPGVSSWCLAGVQDFTAVRNYYALPEKYIFFLGTIEPRKNIIQIIEAYKESQLHKKGYSLLIAGKLGWKSKKIIEYMQKTSGVVYLGYIPEEHKKALYSLASVFVYPSMYEGFGFPVVEAMACGVPVITSNRSSLPEVVSSSAYLVDPTIRQDLTDAMLRILSSGSLRRYYIQKGKVRAEQYSWSLAAKKFLSLLD